MFGTSTHIGVPERDILALDLGVDITGETAGRYHGAAERTRGRGD